MLTNLLRVESFSHIVKGYLLRTVRALIVDEVFDANPLDMELVTLTYGSGVSVTLIGDPWQALYEFRGAQPRLVSELQKSATFEELEMLDSFRYRSDEMLALTCELRAGQPVNLHHMIHDSKADVVLASRWNYLWDCERRILPLSFRLNQQYD